MATVLAMEFTTLATCGRIGREDAENYMKIPREGLKNSKLFQYNTDNLEEDSYLPDSYFVIGGRRFWNRRGIFEIVRVFIELPHIR